jgi:hypothetical protein
MSRFTIGAALGGAAVYFFDPLQGEDRRQRVQSLWRENRDTALQVGGGVSPERLDGDRQLRSASAPRLERPNPSEVPRDSRVRVN